MDTDEEDILVIYVNLIDMVNAITSLQIDFSIRNCQEIKICEIFCFCRKITNTKLLKENQLLDITQ